MNDLWVVLEEADVGELTCADCFTHTRRCSVTSAHLTLEHARAHAERQAKNFCVLNAGFELGRPEETVAVAFGPNGESISWSITQLPFPHAEAGLECPHGKEEENGL